MLVEILVIIIIIKIGISLIILKVSYNKIKEYKSTIENANALIIGINKDFEDKCCEVKKLDKEVKEIKEEMEVYMEQVNKEKKTYELKLDQLKKIREILEG